MSIYKKLDTQFCDREFRVVTTLLVYHWVIITRQGEDDGIHLVYQTHSDETNGYGLSEMV